MNSPVCLCVCLRVLIQLNTRNVRRESDTQERTHIETDKNVNNEHNRADRDRQTIRQTDSNTDKRTHRPTSVPPTRVFLAEHSCGIHQRGALIPCPVTVILYKILLGRGGMV